MDDIVKILLGLIFVGFSIYNSARKKKAKALKSAKRIVANSENEQVPQNNYAEPKPEYIEEKQEEDLSFFDVFKKEVFDNIDTSKPQVTVNFEKTVEIAKEEPEPEIEYDDHKTHSSLIIDDDDFLDFDELNEEKGNKGICFDLEKAVIYSEILKPKYF